MFLGLQVIFRNTLYFFKTKNYLSEVTLYNKYLDNGIQTKNNTQNVLALKKNVLTT